MRFFGLLLLLVGVVGCSKSSDPPKGAPSASAPTPAVSSNAPVASASGSAAAPTAAGAAKAFSGSYSLAPASLHIGDSKDYSNVKQAKDDPSKLVGDGTLTLNVEGDKVTGTVDSGPASPAVIDGSVVDGEIRGNVRRKDPKDDGLTGTLMAKLAGEAAEGKLSLAESNAAILREGKLTLKKK